MSVLELKDAKAQLLEKNDEIFELSDAEKRKLNDKERQTVEDNLAKVEDIDLKLQSFARKDEKGQKVKRSEFIQPKESFSLIKAIRDKAENRAIEDVARDVFTFGKQEFRKAGINFTGDIVLPCEIRADILAGTSTQGQEIVSEDKKAILPPLSDKLVLAQAGATYLTGLVGNVSIPSYAGTSVAWKDEVTIAEEGAGAFSEVEFSPKRLTAFIDVSRLFLAQDGVGAERLLLDNIASAVARKLEETILGVAVGSATQPQGMGYAVTTGADTGAAEGAATWAKVVGLETAVDTANALQGNLAYVTNSTGRGLLKTTKKGSTSDDIMLMDIANTMNGYPVLVTNSASNIVGTSDLGSFLAFGNWADLCICQWGGYDITVDPYTLAPENQVRITINAFFDVKGLRGAESTDVHNSVTQDNHYAHSFDVIGITS